MPAGRVPYPSRRGPAVASLMREAGNIKARGYREQAKLFNSFVGSLGSAAVQYSKSTQQKSIQKMEVENDAMGLVASDYEADIASQGFPSGAATGVPSLPPNPVTGEPQSMGFEGNSMQINPGDMTNDQVLQYVDTINKHAGKWKDFGNDLANKYGAKLLDAIPPVFNPTEIAKTYEHNKVELAKMRIGAGMKPRESVINQKELINKAQPTEHTAAKVQAGKLKMELTEQKIKKQKALTLKAETSIRKMEEGIKILSKGKPITRAAKLDFLGKTSTTINKLQKDITLLNEQLNENSPPSSSFLGFNPPSKEETERYDAGQEALRKEILAIQKNITRVKSLEAEVMGDDSQSGVQQGGGASQQANLEYTARIRGLTVEEVKRRLGLQ